MHDFLSIIFSLNNFNQREMSQIKIWHISWSAKHVAIALLRERNWSGFFVVRIKRKLLIILLGQSNNNNLNVCWHSRLLMSSIMNYNLIFWYLASRNICRQMFRIFWRKLGSWSYDNVCSFAIFFLLFPNYMIWWSRKKRKKKKTLNEIFRHEHRLKNRTLTLYGWKTGV